MTVSRFKAILPGDVQTVWDIVTGVMEYPTWRSDVERVETPGAQTFWEYAKGGYVTKFTITGEEHCRRWTLAMENANLTGRWVGVFRQRGAATVIDFTECVTVKKRWMRPLVKIYLRRQQAQFVGVDTVLGNECPDLFQISVVLLIFHLGLLLGVTYKDSICVTIS